MATNEASKTSTTTNTAAAAASGSNSSESLTLQQRIEQKIEGYDREVGTGRKAVKEDLVKCYELQMAANVLKEMITEERVTSNPLLLQMFQDTIASHERIVRETLATPTTILKPFEQRLLQLVQYQIEHDERDLTGVPGNKKASEWLRRQRMRIIAHMQATASAPSPAAASSEPVIRAGPPSSIEHDIAILQRLHVCFKKPPKKKTFDEYMAELRAFKAKHCHLKVRRIQPDGSSLGEFVHRIRREYDMLQNGDTKVVPNLTPARVAELNELGMIWKIRTGRPKKGDARFRLRRKSDNNNNSNDEQQQEAQGDDSSANSDTASSSKQMQKDDDGDMKGPAVRL